MKVRAICIDDKNKPAEIQQNEWVKESKLYHITHIYYHPGQGVQGVELKEVRLTEKSKPYEAYRLSRFAILVQDIGKFKDLLLACNELNDIDIEKLIEETQLETVENL